MKPNLNIIKRYSSSIRSIKGMHDKYGFEYKLQEYIIQQSTKIVKLYGYSGIQTPTLEPTQLFQQGLGEDSSVIVGKELYTFQMENSNKSLSLRPEGTASVMRAVIQNELLNLNKKLKFFYHGAFFRHERPQRGRSRQFHQFGIENIGCNDIISDVETLLCAQHVLNNFDLQFELRINCLGNEIERKEYTKKLKLYLKEKYDNLSVMSQKRFHTNPLRILDSKDPCDIQLIENAPKLWDSLADDTQKKFNLILQQLKYFNINYNLDFNLVRGLDYYQNLVFEFISLNDNLGKSQNTILAGGRYNGLINKISNKEGNTPSIGWALGIERMALILDKDKLNINRDNKVLIVVIHQSALQYALHLTNELRLNNMQTQLECYFDANMTKLTKKFTTMNNELESSPTHLIYLGEDEIQSGKLRIKKVDVNQQEVIDKDNIIEYFLNR